jgi:hypothetical protein
VSEDKSGDTPIEHPRMAICGNELSMQQYFRQSMTNAYIFTVAHSLGLPYPIEGRMFRFFYKNFDHCATTGLIESLDVHDVFCTLTTTAIDIDTSGQLHRMLLFWHDGWRMIRSGEINKVGSMGKLGTLYFPDMKRELGLES